ncbi:hypothetical protein [Glycomyces algeriensis]|uniref:Uncharacterized protein n=1 Tax=Glycomyces algeriensis TaxID=256037 RepID=A0A9W6GBR2_9ACTN|nr:hypothetical protein [Glycomyces algeriensis]MDA1365588.1 hypothetical protein [Glycomyces algeriensis]MDR7351276.1 hypothetical protein [Glycomyces algeriensis]GLI43991.1 hypothetical protein GALLR39Z86_38410 [Glycomyces algeriensis]
MTGAFLHPDFESAVERALADETGGRLTGLYVPDDRTLTELWAIGRAPDGRARVNPYRDVARHLRLKGERAVYTAADGTRTRLAVPHEGIAAHREPLASRSLAPGVWSHFPAADTRVYVPVSGTFDLGGMADMAVVSGGVVYRVTVDAGPRILRSFIPDVSQGFSAGPR